MKNLLFIFSLILAFAACSDDDTFTTSTYSTLTLPVDTLSLDTVFSKVPAPTKSFWVFNQSGKNIRCSQVKLQNGNQTGFRVNVDGEYLSEERGYQVADVEIRDGDSIRIFVEITSPIQGRDIPSLVEDNLLFNLESGVQQKINLNAWAWDAEMLRDVVIEGEQTIDGHGKPIIVYGGIKVDSLATLNIAAGTTLYFHDGAGIDVYGTLKCNGTADANVTLRGDRLDRMFDYLPYDLVSGQWKGLHFYESSYGNELCFTDLHSAYDGIVCDSSDVSKLKLALEFSTIHNCQGYGVRSVGSCIRMDGCQITNTLMDCVSVVGGKTTAIHCTIAQFYPFDTRNGVALDFNNAIIKDRLADNLSSRATVRDTVTYPIYEFNIVNCIVTGYADDVVMGEQQDTTAGFVYLFLNNVLRTPEVADTVYMVGNVWELSNDSIVGGEKHFRLVSHDTQHYDFHLDSLSSAVGLALPIMALPYDRDGKPYHPDKPSAGCYELNAIKP